MAIDRASSFPEADVDQALNPSQNKEFEVDPVSSDIATSKETRQVLLQFALNSTNLYTQYRSKLWLFFFFLYHLLFEFLNGLVHF